METRIDENMAPIYKDDSFEECIGYVEYNKGNLDTFDGQSWNYGGVGNHRSLAKHETLGYILIDEKDSAMTCLTALRISGAEARKLVLKACCSRDHILNEFPEFKELIIRIDGKKHTLEFKEVYDGRIKYKYGWYMNKEQTIDISIALE